MRVFVPAAVIFGASLRNRVLSRLPAPLPHRPREPHLRQMNPRPINHAHIAHFLGRGTRNAQDGKAKRDNGGRANASETLSIIIPSKFISSFSPPPSTLHPVPSIASLDCESAALGEPLTALTAPRLALMVKMSFALDCVLLPSLFHYCRMFFAKPSFVTNPCFEDRSGSLASCQR